MTTIAPDVIESLETWEELADAARMVAEDMDTGRWTMGDLGNRTERIYGHASLKKLAAEVGMAQADTLYRYCAVSAFYEPRIRIQFPALTHSHYRTAMRAGDQAVAWLETAERDGLPVAELRKQIAAAIGKPVPPRKLAEFTATVGTHGYGVLYLFPHDGDWNLLDEGRRVIVKVYAIETEAEHA